MFWDFKNGFKNINGYEKYPDASGEENERTDRKLETGKTAAGELTQLTADQVRTWTLEQKDRWWLEYVYKGNMPQLTFRSASSGMVIGGILSLTNLYVGARTGWTLGVGITSVILAFAMFKVLSKLGLGNEFTTLENNAMQSIATAAGYMTGPLISSMAAYMSITNRVIPMWVVMLWITALGVLGVLFAFPFKKRFINDEQLPFPEGRAAGIVMHTLHTGTAAMGMFKAKILAATGGISALITLMKSEAIMQRLRLSLLTIPEYFDGWIHQYLTPTILGTPLKNITVRAETDVVMIAVGGLTGIRTGVALLTGAIINYFILVPLMISRGDIVGAVKAGVMIYGLKNIVFWSLWGGVAMMTASSLFSFFSKPQAIVAAFGGFLKKRAKQVDILKDIELPMSVFLVGIPAVGLIVVLLAHYLFDVRIWLGALAIPMVFVFTMIAAHSTGLTSFTPVGPLGKLTQLIYGGLAPGNITTNVVSASITAEVTSNASNLLMDIKPGYMLGAKPRQQAIGHVLGIIAGALVAVPVFYAVFLNGDPHNLMNDKFPMPAATTWKAVADVLAHGLSNVKPSAQLAALIGVILGISLEVLKMATKGRFWLSAVGLSLPFMIPFSSCFSMFLGSFIFWLAGRLVKKDGSFLHETLVKDVEVTCAGFIAGGGLMGIVVILIEKFVLAQ